MSESDSKPETAQPAQKVTASAKSETKTPEEWAGVCGQRRAKTFDETTTAINGRPFDVIGAFNWKHEAASVLHGWKRHEHHAGAALLLTRAEYEGALEAASKTDARGEYLPHKPALSPHKGA